MAESIEIITNDSGEKIVYINDVCFKSRRTLDWLEIEKLLKKYVGQFYEIAETSEKIYIGSDFPDEFAHSKDTKGLKGTNMKAKANISTALPEMIEIATHKTTNTDHNNRHKNKAKYGWYRYNVKFGLPVYNEQNTIERYNIFSTQMLVRCDADGKLYLYDFVRTKKETSKPLE